MQILRSLEDASKRHGSSVVTIGSFDGIHLAHRELLMRIRRSAQDHGAVSVAVTFDPHPVQILAPDKAPKLITPLPIRIELFAKTGIDELLLIPFTKELSLWSPRQFVEQVLVNTLHATVVVIGDNFRFGHNQAGTPQVMEELGHQFGFTTEILPKMSTRGMTVSSSQIRRHLEAGQISKANRLLGHPFSIRGEVESGLGIGSKETVPTLNLENYHELLPANGVYITRTRISPSFPDHTAENFLPSVTNVGCRPTFGNRGIGIETHLLGKWTGASPKAIDVEFLYRLREERKFESAQELKTQIQRDVQRASKYFKLLTLFLVS